jgi:hypothetical protein
MTGDQEMANNNLASSFRIMADLMSQYGNALAANQMYEDVDELAQSGTAEAYRTAIARWKGYTAPNGEYPQKRVHEKACGVLGETSQWENAG